MPSSLSAPSPTSIAKKISEATGKMTHLCRCIIIAGRHKPHFSCNFLDNLAIFRRLFRFIFDRVLICSSSPSSVLSKTSRPNPHRNKTDGKNYRRLSHRRNTASEVEEEDVLEFVGRVDSSRTGFDSDSDLVPLKISLLGDCQIGKTSFVIKYIGDEQESKSLQMKGLNLMDKTLIVKGARIAFSFWDVGGDPGSVDHLPIACKDAVAILFMFDLTSRCTLHSIIGWYTQAMKWNQNAIPILIGTKFDDFIRLPPDLQRTIISQARSYAKTMNATLFFSSSKHNINVNKIFKFITAKLFNLPWTVKRNLTVGEPIIDF